ncbi:MAG: ribose transport system substrate-binding protein [Mycobacteriales bacterium]|jgi:ribose transport system substrate-binding protein
MRRRVLAAVSTLAVIAAVSACGSSDNSGSGGSGGGKKSLTLIQGTKADEFYITMACGAQAAAQSLGVSLDVTGPEKFDAGQQVPIVNSVTAKKPNAVLIAPTDTKALIPPMTQMKAAGIKIVEVDTTVDDDSLAVSAISTDNLGGGKLAAQTLAKLVGGKGSVLVINVNPGISTTDARAKGFDDEIKNSSGITALPVQYTNDEPARAAAIVSATLSAHPDLAGIFATNVLTAEGAATGLRAAGKQNQVKIVGFDAGPQQIQDLKSGVVQALVAQDPYGIGQKGVQTAVDALAGKDVPKQIQTDLFALTKDNVDSPDAQKFIYKDKC